jgi:uncharacterized protein (TIGR01777 family)
MLGVSNEQTLQLDALLSYDDGSAGEHAQEDGEAMNIVIAGGTGFIGRALCCAMVEEGHRVSVLSRSLREESRLSDPNNPLVTWNGLTSGQWEQAVEGADAIINLAGEPIADGRWTRERKRVLRESRTGATRLLIQAVSRLHVRPRTLINASGIGYYGACGSSPVNEQSPAGSGFSADLCVAWEQEAMMAETLGLRVVRLRIGMVLGQDGGALPRMLLPFRLFLGGPIAPGDQWISWIHRRDVVGLIRWALGNPAVSGAMNAVAPGAVTMRDFCHMLGRVMHRPSWLPVPELAIRLGLGELGTLLTTGQRVNPTVALREGYVFHYSTLEPALQAILGTE